MKKRNIKYGFTLAEILIAIAIIGVISALTIPSAIIRYQKKETAAKLEKIYSTLERALVMARAQHGDPKSWNWPYGNDSYNKKRGKQFADIYLKPYLNLKTDYGTVPNSISPYYIQEGTLMRWLPNIARSNTYVVHSDYLLSDNTLVGFSEIFQHTTYLLSVTIDINGLKKPNIKGKDIFYINYYMRNGILKPDDSNASKLNDRETLINNCKTQDNQACFDLIRYNNWQFPDYYPW